MYIATREGLGQLNPERAACWSLAQDCKKACNRGPKKARPDCLKRCKQHYHACHDICDGEYGACKGPCTNKDGATDIDCLEICRNNLAACLGYEPRFKSETAPPKKTTKAPSQKKKKQGVNPYIEGTRWCSQHQDACEKSCIQNGVLDLDCVEKCRTEGTLCLDQVERVHGRK